MEQEKQKKVIEDIVKRSHVTVAENFQVKMPEPQQMPGMPPGICSGPAESWGSSSWRASTKPGEAEG